MSGEILFYIILMVVLIMMSAFFSASETALLSINKIRLKNITESGNKNAGLVEDLLKNANYMLGSILLGNNAVNTAVAAVGTTLVIKMNIRGGIGLSTAVITLLILIFGEITPKNLAMKFPDKIALRVAPIIGFLVWALTPAVFILTKITHLFIRIFGGDISSEKPFITQEELKTIVDVSNQEGVLESDEKEMIYNVIDYGGLRVRDVMIQRMDVVAVSLEESFEEVQRIFTEYGFSRIPVYEDTIDDIVGMLFAKDLLFLSDEQLHNFDIKEYLRPSFKTFEFIKISDFFKRMQKDRNHIAIVYDEYGGVAGIITMEDIIESILGDINDEFDSMEEDILAVKEDEYVVNGYSKLEDINDMIGSHLESEDFESIGGLLIGLLGRLPKEGEAVQYNGMKLIVENVDKNRIAKVRIIM